MANESLSSQTPGASGTPQAPPLEKATRPGNYFVTNYPPYAFWKPEQVPVFEAALREPPRPDVWLGVYAHIPFCRKRCHFCYYKVYTDKDARQVWNYLEAMLQELARYARQPFVGGRKPKFVYFGGGTPSYLSEKQMRHLTDEMKRLLPWDEAEEVTFEAEPGTLTDHKLRTIREVGVTRLSLGIEHFDDHILEINGRAHRSREILRAYHYAREVGFPQINIDLIAGMVEETEERWRETVERALELKPDSLTVYQMEVPFNTTLYQRMKAEGKLVAPVADWETKRRWVDYAFRRFEEAGYTVTSTSTVVKDPERTRFVYRHQLFSGADILSVGVASFGHINGVHYQNHHEFDPYVRAIQEGRSPVYRALKPTREELCIRELMLLLKLGEVRRDYFVRKFGTDPVEAFAEPIRRLKATGHLVVEPDRLRLDRAGLLKVDELIREFFKPEHRGGKYA
ncbi:MAG: coproporphyrinogen III oxidase family protein [Verrucomicrobia bacterium]|nr:MAG: coproporphyrinogen III oxidase family protein [Verrucomicrobiota bacterium]